EDAPINPGVPRFKLLWSHVLRREYAVGGVVERPIFMQDASLGFHSSEQRSIRIRREDVEGGVFEPLLLDPAGQILEHLWAVLIEAQNKAPVHLNAVAVEDLNSSRIVIGSRAPLARRPDVLVGEALETYEDARTSGKRHLAHQVRFVGDIERDGGAPDLLQGSKLLTKSLKIAAI